MNVNNKLLVASFTFSSSPFENIYLKLAKITAKIATTTEKDVARLNR